MLNGRGRTLSHDDAGFSVVEILVAATILFFALTAMAGLMGVTTNMSVDAKGNSVLSNAVSSELDRVRALPFAQVGLTSEPSGTIPPVQNLGVVEGFSVVLRWRIWLDDDGTKQVVVTGTATRDGRPPVTTSANMVLRDRFGMTADEDALAPTVEFLTGTPIGNQTVYTNRTASNLPLNIGVKAHATSGRAISRILMSVTSIGAGDVPLRDGNTVYADPADFNYPGSTDQDKTEYFVWNTAQVDNAGVGAIRDGYRFITVRAWDDVGRSSTPLIRAYLVDNKEPDVPASVAYSVQTGINTLPTLTHRASWGAAMDGDVPAPYYEADLFEDRNGASNYTAWNKIITASRADQIDGVSASAFGRYVMRVRALSPLQNPSEYAVSGTVYSPPVMTGTCDIRRASGTPSNYHSWTHTSHLAVPGPRFPCEVVSVRVLRNGTPLTTGPTPTTVAAAWATTGGVYEFSDAFTQSKFKNQLADPPVYRFEVTVRPTGSTDSVVLRSNTAVGPRQDLALGSTVPGLTMTYAW